MEYYAAKDVLRWEHRSDSTKRNSGGTANRNVGHQSENNVLTWRLDNESRAREIRKAAEFRRI